MSPKEFCQSFDPRPSMDKFLDDERMSEEQYKKFKVYDKWITRSSAAVTLGAPLADFYGGYDTLTTVLLAGFVVGSVKAIGYFRPIEATLSETPQEDLQLSEPQASETSVYQLTEGSPSQILSGRESSQANSGPVQRTLHVLPLHTAFGHPSGIARPKLL